MPLSKKKVCRFNDNYTRKNTIFATNNGNYDEKTFVDFGESSTAIVKALGSLFVSSEARESMGGIIAIGFESTNILKNFGFVSFLIFMVVF